jgi:DNA-binding MarR family transcriptional regulator
MVSWSWILRRRRRLARRRRTHVAEWLGAMEETAGRLLHRGVRAVTTARPAVGRRALGVPQRRSGAALAPRRSRGGAVELLERLSNLQISPTELRILAELRYAACELTIHALAARTGHWCPQVSRAVQAFVERGLVARRKDLDDRRYRQVGLLEAGEALLHELERSLAGRGARTPQPEVPPLARSTGRRRG